MEKLLPLLGTENIEETWCRPNFKNDVNRQKNF